MRPAKREPYKMYGRLANRGTRGKHLRRPPDRETGFIFLPNDYGVIRVLLAQKKIGKITMDHRGVWRFFSRGTGEKFFYKFEQLKRWLDEEFKGEAANEDQM